MKNFISLLTIFCFILNSSIAMAFEYEICNLGWKHVHHKHNESSYQHTWCKAHNGVEEFVNKDYTRVDCVTDVHAVEFDFANKWAESIGQAEHYAKMTGKKGMVVLILENPQAEMVYYNRVKELAKLHNFDTEYITSDILHIVDDKCEYQDCKCHRKKSLNIFKKIFKKFSCSFVK